MSTRSWLIPPAPGVELRPRKDILVNYKEYAMIAEVRKMDEEKQDGGA